MLYPYEEMIGLDAYTREVATGSGQVYALADLGFSTPLPTVDVNGLPVELSVDPETGFLPSFNVEGHTEVRFKSGDFTKVLVTTRAIPGGPGDPGPAGPPPEMISGTTTTVDPEYVAFARVVPAGEGKYRINMDIPRGAKGDPGDRGLPGLEAMPQAEGMAQHISTPGPVQTALNAQTVEATTQKMIFGGRVPKPVRAPVLVVDREFPQPSNDYELLWRDGDTVYAQSFAGDIVKSTDSGTTWEHRGKPPYRSYLGRFIKLQNGTLLLGTSTAQGLIYRSTDDGTTWTHVWSLRPDMQLMGIQSWVQDQVSGWIYYGEYQYVDNMADIRVYRSADNGASWHTFHTFPGPTSTSADKVRHIHSVQWDPISQRVYIMAGDTEPASGIYRVNAAGSGVEKVILNRDGVAAGHSMVARTIGIMFFKDHLVWGKDAPTAPYVYRMHRDQIGATAPKVEQTYQLSSSAWFVTRAANDGSRWLVASSNEAGNDRIDNSAHLYAVEDEGRTIYEVGAFSSESVAFATITPVGQPENHGDVFWLRSHGFEYEWGIKGRLGYGTTAIPKPAKPGTYHARPDLPDNFTRGEGNMPRWLATMTFTASKGRVQGAAFTANRTETITKLTVATAANAAEATPSVVRLGVFEVYPNGLMAMVASTANDPTMLSAPWTAYTRTLTKPWRKKRGVQYVMGVLIVTDKTPPSLVGWSAPGGVAFPEFSGPMFAVATPGSAMTDLNFDALTMNGSAVAPYILGSTG